MNSLLLINATQHNQSNQPWADLGVYFTNPAFTPWGFVSPTSQLKQVVSDAWAKIQAEWNLARSHGLVPSGILVGGYAPLIVPVAAYAMAQALPPPVVVAVMGPAPTVEGERRSFILSGWRMIPPQGVVIREGSPLPPKLRYNWEGMVYCSARPLSDVQKASIEAHTTARLITPCPPALPPQSGVDIEDYEEQCRAYISAAATAKCGCILLDGPPAETAIRVALLARSYGIQMWFTRTGKAEVGKQPPIVGVERIVAY